MSALVVGAFSVGVASLVAAIAPRPRELLYFVMMLVSVAIGVAVTGPSDAAFVIVLCLALAVSTIAGSSTGLFWRRKRRGPRRPRGHRWPGGPRRGKD